MPIYIYKDSLCIGPTRRCIFFWCKITGIATRSTVRLGEKGGKPAKKRRV